MIANRSIRTAVFIAPVIIIALMLAVIVIFDHALRQQQNAFLDVVHGPLARATTSTTRLLLQVSEVQAELLRYTQLRQRLSAEDPVLGELRRSILSKYEIIGETFEALRSASPGPGEADVIANIEDFLTIHSAVSARLVGGGPIDTMSVSTVMAHYQQLQSYIAEFAERSLESAQITTDRTEREVRSLAQWLVIGSGVVILVAILVTVYVGRAISRPIIGMIDILTAIAAGKDVPGVPDQERRDEIGAMARAVSVFDTVTRELRENERSLEEARRHAESANAAKSAFLANVSHELRTPLTSILGFTAIIRRRLERSILPGVATSDDPKVLSAVAQVRENIDIILAEGERLTALINNVLDLEKIEAGEMSLEIESLDVGDLIAQSRAATAALHEARGLAFETDVPPSLPAVRADRDKIIQVLINLISNAAKFTAAGHIRCAASLRDDGFVEVSVSDTGRGIAREAQDAVFEKFRQVGDTLTGKPTGTGLGLAICREIIEHFGGTICLESTPGLGSTFSFTIPCAPDTPVTAALSSEDSR